MTREDWLGLVGDSSVANVGQKIQGRMPGVLKEVLDAVKLHHVGVGDLVSRYPLRDFTVDDLPQKRIIATNNSVVVSNTNSPGYTRGIAKLDSLGEFAAFTNTRLEAQTELVTDAEISLCHRLPVGGCQKFFGQTVRVHFTFSGTVPILAALSLSQPRVQLFDGKQQLAFDFNVSLTAEGATWDGVGVSADVATCQIGIGGVSLGRACSRIEGMLRRRSLERREDLAITEAATERMVSQFKDQIRAAVGPTVTVPINLISASVLYS